MDVKGLSVEIWILLMPMMAAANAGEIQRGNMRHNKQMWPFPSIRNNYVLDFFRGEAESIARTCIAVQFSLYRGYNFT